MGGFVACCVLIALIIGYIMFAINQNFKEHENDVKSLQQKIFELEDEVKELKREQT